MPEPNPWPCGGQGQRPCPPQPAVATSYTLAEVHAYGQACYQKGRTDERMVSHPADDGPK